ncbi:MAG: hypothetical protein ABIQ44_06155, partial [Chloroflexia bacterium]
PIPATLLLWGFLLAGFIAYNLFEGTSRSRLTWTLVTVVAYGVLTLPSILPLGALPAIQSTIDVIALVTALTLAAQLGRRDLPRALRDWALIMAISLYTSLGVQAMKLVVNGFSDKIGPLVLLVLLPPLAFEALSLIMRRIGRLGSSPTANVFAVAIATALGVIIFAFTMFNASTPTIWRILFGFVVALLIGGALLVGLMTRPLVFAASGSRATPTKGFNLARTLVELSHDPILIALAIYIPLRLLSFVPAQ